MRAGRDHANELLMEVLPFRWWMARRTPAPSAMRLVGNLEVWLSSSQCFFSQVVGGTNEDWKLRMTYQDNKLLSCYVARLAKQKKQTKKGKNKKKNKRRKNNKQKEKMIPLSFTTSQRRMITALIISSKDER
jgi:hypothetical protein